MSSEDSFDDKPLADIDESAVAKALDSEHVFQRSSAPPSNPIPSASSTDAFPDEPEPEPEPMPEPQPLDAEVVDPAHPDLSVVAENGHAPQSSYGHTDPASLAAAGSGELKDAQLGPAQTQALADAALGSAAETPHASEQMAFGEKSSEGLVLQPHLAHLAQVGLADADTWGEQFKPRIDSLHTQIDEVNVRLDQLTTPQRKNR